MATEHVRAVISSAQSKKLRLCGVFECGRASLKSFRFRLERRTYILIYIYTSAYPCIPCTKYVRLRVECNRHPRSCPAKRLRVSLVYPVRFVFVRLCPVERPSEAERGPEHIHALRIDEQSQVSRASRDRSTEFSNKQANKQTSNQANTQALVF